MNKSKCNFFSICLVKVSLFNVLKKNLFLFSKDANTRLKKNQMYIIYLEDEGTTNLSLFMY